MKKIKLILILLCFASIAFSQGTPVSRATLTTQPYSWVYRTVPPLTYLQNTWASFVNKVDDGSPWSTIGNALTTNTLFLGTTTSRSLIFKTNSTEFLKLDSLGRFYWKQSSANLASLQGLVSFTSVPAFYMGVPTPAVDNYAILADGTNNVFNGPDMLFLRTKNTSFLQATTTPTTTAEFIVFNAINVPTVAATNPMAHIRIAGNTIGWNAGTTTNQFKINISADTYTSNGAATITHPVAVNITAPTAGTGMTFANPAWGIRSTGGTNLTGSVIIGATITDYPTKQLDVRGNAIISSSLTTNGIANTGTMSTTSTFSLGAANLTGGNTGTVAVLTDNIISFQFGWAVQSPADAQTYWLGSTGLFNANVAGNNRIVLPVNCSLIGYSFNNINLGLNGSAETATLNIRKNATTTTALNTSLTFASTNLTSDFTKSVSFAAGDDFAPNIVCPTWATNPLQTVLTVVFYFKRE